MRLSFSGTSHINPSGFWGGGFDADTGWTGRKRLCPMPMETLSHTSGGGGAFSGKDPTTKVTALGCYMARRIAVDLFFAKIKEKQGKYCYLSYAIGYASNNGSVIT